MTDIQKRLISFAEPEFREFNARLLPSVGKENVIGVKTPQLRALAKEMIKEGSANDFLSELPHEFFEENQLHAFIINEEKDFQALVCKIDAFLPYVDNWATCDQMTAKALSNNKKELLLKIEEWLVCERAYTVRFGICKMMQFFLDSDFEPEYLERIAKIKSDDYYVNMALAWFFATALAKQYESTLPHIENRVLDTWVHNKTIQKAKESFRVSNEHKAYLEKLKIKN